MKDRMEEGENKQYKLFLDESGECSFSEKTIYKHFLIAILSICPDEVKILKKRLKTIFRKFIKKGWPKGEEIKAAALYRHNRFGAEAIEKVLRKLLNIESLGVSYIVVNKGGIDSEAFRQASYGIPYNYFTGVLISEIIFKDKFYNTHLVYDLRNKETHSKRHFKEYLQTKIFGMGLEKNIEVKFSVEAADSAKNYGLTAVDFCSWAIYRNFEYDDDRFFKKLKDKLRRRREWYI